MKNCKLINGVYSFRIIFQITISADLIACKIGLQLKRHNYAL